MSKNNMPEMIWNTFDLKMVWNRRVQYYYGFNSQKMTQLTLSLFVTKFGLIATLISKVRIRRKRFTEQPIYATILSPRPNICV